MDPRPEVAGFFHADTSTVTYVVFDPATRDALILDPVLDYDQRRSHTATEALENLLTFVEQKKLKVHWLLETHAHADHLSGAPWLHERLGAPVAIGAGITLVQEAFRDVFGVPNMAIDGSQFDRLLQDGDHFSAGSLRIQVMNTPGHTPACVSYLIGDALFTGDALFMDDYGTGRCDFPHGSADDLYTSIHDKLYALPDATRVFVGHDYQPGGRALRWETTIGRSKQHNPQLRADTRRDDFVQFRTQRDAGLSPPRLLFQSVRVNADGGRLPEPSTNGVRYLTIPLNHPVTRG